MDHVPIVTVITDLGRVHEGWLLPEADLTIVPAREVYNRAHRTRRPAQPLAADRPSDPSEVRRRLGDQERDPQQARACRKNATIALLMAGGEGGGKLLPTTLALAKTQLPFHLVVVTGRNAALKAKLEELAPSLADADDRARLPQRRARN